MDNYIQIYKNALDDSYCDELIKKFENNQDQIEVYDQDPVCLISLIKCGRMILYMNILE